MNDYTAKKLGEVMAFVRVGGEQIKKSKTALLEAMDEVEVERILHMYEEHERQMSDLADASLKSEIIKTKALATADKIRAMSNLYMKEESDWEDPSEVIEWLGFFEGGAIVHFKLAQAAAETLGLLEVSTFTTAGVNAHSGLLEDLKIAIKRVVKNKAE
jgi:hypothetical protein